MRRASGLGGAVQQAIIPLTLAAEINSGFWLKLACLYTIAADVCVPRNCTSLGSGRITRISLLLLGILRIGMYRHICQSVLKYVASLSILQIGFQPCDTLCRELCNNRLTFSGSFEAEYMMRFPLRSAWRGFCHCHNLCHPKLIWHLAGLSKEHQHP